MAEGCHTHGRKSAGHVLVLPYPAEGHMIPLLHLAGHLSSRFGLAVTVAVTPKNLRSLSPLLARSPDVEPLVLPFPDYPSLPPGVENVKDIQLGPQFRYLMHALSGLHDPLLRWARTTPNPPTAIISDIFLGWTRRLADELGVPRLVFSPSGAYAIAVGNDIWRRMPEIGDSEEPVAFPSLPGAPVYPRQQLPGATRVFKTRDILSDFYREGFLDNMRSWGFVFNTFSELEEVYLGHLCKDLGHSRVWAVGPLAENLSNGGASTENGSVSSVASTEEAMSWLDGREEGSVVYVAFGSMRVLTQEQAAAVAAALERSGAAFIWAARGGTPVPEGFEERTAGRGFVIRDWAPQVAILSHDAVGSFLTHCGWNSVLEAVAARVALLTWPMMADQFINARLLVEAAGVGAVACDGGGEVVPDAEDLARVIADSVGESGRERRNRAKELKESAAMAVKEGGSSFKQMEEMVNLLSEFGAK